VVNRRKKGKKKRGKTAIEGGKRKGEKAGAGWSVPEERGKTKSGRL